MKTLEDYIRGYPAVPVLLIAEHKEGNVRYSLCKEEHNASFYFMKDEEVLDVKRFAHDEFPKLAIMHLNHKQDLGIIEKIKNCSSYKAFVKFVKENTNKDFII